MSEPIPPGVNPRDHFRRHKERGPIRYWYSVPDVARACGVTVETVRLWARTGRLDLADLASVARVIARRL